jgi:[protein-PII] uridylyltransferase
MVQISQRRDLDDPEVIQGFANEIKTAENLTMLTLHTVADSLGTSDKLWNGFKDSLLQSLHYKTLTLLGGGTDFIRAENQLIQQLKEEVRPLLPPTFNVDEVEAHFQSLPTRYFNVHTARQIASDIVLAHRFMHLQMVEADVALSPVVTWHNEPDRGFTSLHICTWDRSGLFSKIAGSLTAAGLNVLSARIFSRTDGLILDTFFVTGANSGGLAKREERERFEEILQKMLSGEDVDIQTLIEKQRGVVVPYKSLEGDQITTVIKFDNKSAARRTIIDIETEDRVGLLYAISNTFADLGLDLALAKIVTEKGAAIDSFYVRNLNGTKIDTEAQQVLVREKLYLAIGRLA